MRNVFELEVWHKQDEQSCIFLLLWEQRQKKLTASLPYSKDIQKLYQRWRKWYHRFYRLSSPQSPGNSGQLNLGSGDLAHDLMEAEKELIQAFQRWLGEGDFRTIQQRIQDELVRLTQSMPKPAPNSTKDLWSQPGVDVFLACESDEMARLPWEAWSLASEFVEPGMLRIVRTVINQPEIARAVPHQRRKPRILAVLGDDPNLPLQADWQAVQLLKPIATIERFIWQPDDSASMIKQRFATKIRDQRGWDILFFAGHSDETAVTGGRLAITASVSLSISEIEDYLTEARDHGLQLAIFNSCSGLSIANSLVALGLQTVAMRDRIRNDVAQRFLVPLCQQLANHSNIHDALLRATQQLRSAEKFAYPSAHLIPSFFSPSGATAYRIKPFGWKGELQQWLPTKRDAIALSAITTISLMVPVQDLLLDLRTAAQAGYREWTSQIREQPPPVTLIAIDQESLNYADQEIKNFQIQPIDREYLSQIIDQLSNSEANVVGIDYFLDMEQPRETLLASSIRRAVQEENTWFIFATKNRDKRWTRNEIASPTWSLEGDAYVSEGRVKLPEEKTCAQPCPFAYSLALAGIVNQNISFDDSPKAALSNYTNFQQELSLFLKKTDRAAVEPFLSQATSPLSLPYIIDFSIPPNQIYKQIPAWQFLSMPAASNKLNQTIVIVASDGYVEAKDQYSTPTAFEYWCRSAYLAEYYQEDCPSYITGGELHAYIVHHLLNSHLIVLIPDWWIICLSALLGKGIGFYLLKQPANRHKQQICILLVGMMGYSLFALQIYISAAVLIPVILPSAIFLLYVTPILKKKAYVDSYG